MNTSRRKTHRQKIKSRNLLLYVQLLVGMSLIIALFLIVGADRIINVLASVNLMKVIPLVLNLIVLYILGAFNIWVLLNKLHPVSFSSFLKIYLTGWAMTPITPGQTGDASVILFLKKLDIAYSTTTTAYLLDKIITLTLFFLISIVGLTALQQKIIFSLRLPISYILLSVIITVTICIYSLKKTRYYIRIVDFTVNIRKNVNTFKYSWKILLINFILTILKWIMMSSAFYMAFLCFDEHITWFGASVIPIISTLVGYIPISFAGLGTVEITATYLFHIIGIQEPIVVSAYLVMRIIRYLLAALLMISLSVYNKSES